MKPSPADLDALFQHPPEAARPWVYWYWMNGNVSRDGITADLEAMAQAGIGGAYLMPIGGTVEPLAQNVPAVETLSAAWWEMVRHAMEEADRLGLKLAMHACDGFAVAGGPWITPALSMQKVVWSETRVVGGRRFVCSLSQPPTNEGFYRDIAVLAFPMPEGAFSAAMPTVSVSQPGVDAQFLARKGGTEIFRSAEPCSIRYAFEQPFTCRSITITGGGNNYQANRLLVEAGDDGEHFRAVARLEPPRHGWQDGDADVTHAIPPTTARFFRFVWDRAGSEPGAEDLDAAKWTPVLRLRRIALSSAPRLHQFEGKTGAVWRVSPRTTAEQIPEALCVPRAEIIDITDHLDGDGRLVWDAPAGAWTILRLGHTSTGHRNETGGGGRGLECDKLNPEAARAQFEHWFGEALRQPGSGVLQIFHVDSWECGSQNWSPGFREEFGRRRGYDPLPYLPAMAGIPVGSADVSERFLHDVRETIAALIVDNFYTPLAERARAAGCAFSAECVAPTMTSDGMLHYRAVDFPMGEFWLRSPTHDKPNDIRDAISGAHIYGKPIIQAEAFTELRIGWDEHPAGLKALGDRNYCLGINRFVYHVFTHNPWLDRRPGMTLNGIGLYFQRDQTWWRPGRAWVEYVTRCQALLQQGRPVADIAVFTGEEIPRRAVLPERLPATLPGIFGADVVAREAERRANRGEPVREQPAGVLHSANIADPADWVDPLRGYAYDSLNPDALLRLATVRESRITLPGGASYGLLLLPESRLLSPEVAARLRALVAEGATVLVGDATPFAGESFDGLGIPRDFVAEEAGARADDIAWTHRAGPGGDIYFVSNQRDARRTIEASLRVAGRVPELWDAVTGERRRARSWRIENGRTVLPLRLEPGGSIFIVLREPTECESEDTGKNWREPQAVGPLDGPWQVAFDPAFGGPENPVVFEELESWTERVEPGVRHYSGTATYTRTFTWSAATGEARRMWLDLGRVADIAEVRINGTTCGVAWTAPWQVEITGALRPGENHLQIEVTNTWANRLIGDQALPESERTTWTSAPYRLEGKPLREAGLLGPVTLVGE